MKKVLTVMIIGLLCFSMFSTFAPQVNAQSASAYLTDLVQLTANSYDDRGASWSPDSSKIAYCAFSDSWYRHIWLMNADGSSKTQLTFGNVVDEGPDYSPDGTKIAFTRYGLRGSGIHDIFIMNVDGTGINRITSTGLARLNARWSNDGQKLAFYYGGAGTTTNEIHIMNIDGTNEVTVASGTYPVMNPYWSPDDTKLVYTMDDGIWVASTSPPYQKTRVFQTSLPTMYAVFSPDGKHIIYSSGVYGQLQNLYLVDINGNFIAQLTYDTKFAYLFDWSPDGQYIALNSFSSGNYDVWRAKILIEDKLLVGYWKFDEGSGVVAQDSSGCGNNGIIHTATWTTGKVGNALHFNGVDSWVEVPNDPTLTAFSQITLEAWIQEDIVTAQLKGIISKCDGWAPPTNAEYFLGTNDNGRVFFETDHNVAIVGTQTDRLITQSGRWYHVAATWSGGSYAVYVDGQSVLTGTCTPQTTLSNTLPVQIGRHGTWSWVYFQGIIDEVKIYNYARTAEEIQADFSANAGPVGYWKFDEGLGGIALDSSGNHNDGAIHGASWTTGISNGALQFDGINDYVAIPSYPSLTLTVNQASVEMWFKPTVTLDGTLTHRINILDKGDGYGFQMEPGARIFFTVWIGGNQWLGTVTSNWIAGKWYHIAGTYDGTTEKVYVNGILENSQPLSGSLSGNSLPLSIGSYCYGSMNFFNGAIDEVKIYNYARTAEEIQSDYSSGATPADFEISVTPDIQTVQPPVTGQIDSSVYYQVKVVSKNGFNSRVDLTLSFEPYPAHIGCVFDPGFVTPPPNGEVFATLRINIYSDTSLKTYALKVSGQAGGLTGLSNSFELSVERSLEVPYQSQDGAKWCGPASLAMALNYYGITYHCWNYAEDENLGTNDGVNFGQLQEYINANYGSSPYSLTTELKNHKQSNTPKNDIFLDIQSKIMQTYPILLNLESLDETQRHAVVVTGFNETGVFVNDPSGALFDPDGYFLKWNPAPASNLHAYAPWSQVGQFAAESLTVGGQPDPLGATSDLVRSDMYFVDENNVYSEYNVLDRGLVWSPDKVARTSPDYTLYYSVNVNNPSNFRQEFTVWVSIVGQVSKSAYVTPYSSSSELTLDPYSRGYIQQQSVRLGDYLSDKIHFYHIKVQLCDSQGNVVDSFTTGIHGVSKSNSYIYYSKKGVSAKLQEPWQHLYLHVYDELGNHVGLNYSTNQIEEGILQALYYDNENGTIIIIVPEVMNLAITVDAKYAEKPIESYNLTVTSNSDAGIFSQTCFENIASGEQQEFSVKASETSLTLYKCAYVDINPKSLNLVSKGNWITAYIELGKSFSMENVDVSSIQLDGTISIAPSAPMAIGDYDSDGVPDLVVKFDRKAVISYIYNQGMRYGNVALTITGQLNDGTPFEGSDVIKVIFPDLNNDRKVDGRDLIIVIRAFGTTPSCPQGTGLFQWNPIADVNQDGRVDARDLTLVASNYGAIVP